MITWIRSIFTRQPPYTVTLGWYDDVERKLQRLRHLANTEDNVDVIRRALALYDWSLTQKLAGNTLMLRNEDGAMTDVDIP